MKKLLILFMVATSIAACNNSSDGTSTNDSTNTIGDTLNPATGGSIDTSSAGTTDHTRNANRDTSGNTADTLK